MPLFSLPFFSRPLPLFSFVLAWAGLRRKSSLAPLQQTSHNQALLQEQQKSSEAKTGPAAALGRQQSWAGRTPRIPTSRKGEQKGCHTRSGDTNPCQSCTLPTHVLSLLPKVLLPKHSRLHTLCSSFCHKSGLQKLNRFNPAPRIKTLPGVSLILFDFTMHTSELSAM